MHICPQEIMQFLQAYEMLKPYTFLVKSFCESCFNGTHKNCEDHAHDSENKEEFD